MVNIKGTLTNPGRSANLHQFGFDEDDDLLTYNTSYKVSAGKTQHTEYALVDRGANGFVAGADCVLIGKHITQRHVSITGINNHQMNNIPIATVGA